jgi:hypothetical protein
MSFKATFTFNSTDFDVIVCTYSMHQSTDLKGRPSSGVNAGTISLQIHASDDKSLISWMIDPYKKGDGKISFQKIDQDSILKTIEFKEAYCTQFTETFVSEGSTPMTISLSISANEMIVDGVSHHNRW